ncbi:unnamed protein product [Owenia fusiformis]|uniref:Uncharacterized protein n=1 Tax=Owenia fusiformis TaxID=6347 RepID=A0A8J1Y055_OWEFU|nr:unnamed protein product [Owenia fusiformis]
MFHKITSPRSVCTILLKKLSLDHLQQNHLNRKMLQSCILLSCLLSLCHAGVLGTQQGSTENIEKQDQEYNLDDGLNRLDVEKRWFIIRTKPSLKNIKILNRGLPQHMAYSRFFHAYGKRNNMPSIPTRNSQKDLKMGLLAALVDILDDLHREH